MGLMWDCLGCREWFGVMGVCEWGAGCVGVLIVFRVLGCFGLMCDPGCWECSRVCWVCGGVLGVFRVLGALRGAESVLGCCEWFGVLGVSYGVGGVSGCLGCPGSWE